MRRLHPFPEWQCRPHGWAYIYRGPTALRIWREIDPVSRDVTAFHIQWQQAAETPVYLDGRPHPPDYAPYTGWDFSTATWEGDILKITTTHIKEDYYAATASSSATRRPSPPIWIAARRLS